MSVLFLTCTHIHTYRGGEKERGRKKLLMMKNRLELAALGCYYTQGFSKARIKSLKTVIGALH